MLDVLNIIAENNCLSALTAMSNEQKSAASKTHKHSKGGGGGGGLE
jgi:hypothetical protein